MRWEKDFDNSWSAMSGSRDIAFIVQRSTDGRFVWRSRDIAPGKYFRPRSGGDAATLAGAKRAVVRFWQAWLTAAGLREIDK